LRSRSLIASTWWLVEAGDRGRHDAARGVRTIPIGVLVADHRVVAVANWRIGGGVLIFGRARETR
jgi:hypothetical protein